MTWRDFLVVGGALVVVIVCVMYLWRERMARERAAAEQRARARQVRLSSPRRIERLHVIDPTPGDVHKIERDR